MVLEGIRVFVGNLKPVTFVVTRIIYERCAHVGNGNTENFLGRLARRLVRVIVVYLDSGHAPLQVEVRTDGRLTDGHIRDMTLSHLGIAPDAPDDRRNIP